MDYISKLIKQYLAGRHLPETEAKIQQWLAEDIHSEAKDAALRDYFDSIEMRADKNTYKALAKLRKRLGMEAPVRTLFPVRKLLLRAAAVLLPLMVIAGVYWYINKPIPVIEVIAAYGEQKQVILPDGSQVWINSGSQLSYPERFTKKRTMHLSGEAYFSVVKDAKKPFIVETECMSVQALGTEFNVTGYPDDDKTTTALVSGKIQVDIQGGKSYLLSPNQQLSVYRDYINEPEITRVTADDVIAKRDGGLVFDNATLPEILRTVERKFNVDITIKSVLPEDRYSVKFVNGETFEQVMDVLEDVTGGFEWK